MANIVTAIIAILLSLLPVGELRIGIPFMIAGGYDPLFAFLVCVAANIIIIPVIFIFLDYLHAGLLRFSFYRKTFAFALQRVRKRERQVAKNIEKYGLIALALFVSIPLPVTGAYTGSLLAWILGIEKKKAAAFIALGVFIAGILITLASIGVITAFSVFSSAS